MDEWNEKPSVFVNWLAIAPIFAPILSAFWFAMALAFVEFPHPAVNGILGLGIMFITTKTGMIGAYCSPFAIAATLFMIDWSNIMLAGFVVVASLYWAFCYYTFWSSVSKVESGEYESVRIYDIGGKLLDEYFSKDEFFSKGR